MIPAYYIKPLTLFYICFINIIKNTIKYNRTCELLWFQLNKIQFVTQWNFNPKSKSEFERNRESFSASVLVLITDHLNMIRAQIAASVHHQLLIQYNNTELVTGDAWIARGPPCGQTKSTRITRLLPINLIRIEWDRHFFLNRFITIRSSTVKKIP